MPEADKVVNEPLLWVADPMATLFIEPTVVGLIVTAPVVLKVTLVAAVNVEKAPVLGVVAPMGVLLIDPPVIAKPEPLIVPDAVRLVNVPACAAELPITILLMLPVVAGLMVTTPEPVGDMITLALTGEAVSELVKVAAPLAAKVVKAPLLRVVAPTDVLLIAPPVIATAVAFWVDIVPRDAAVTYPAGFDAAYREVSVG